MPSPAGLRSPPFLKCCAANVTFNSSASAAVTTAYNDVCRQQLALPKNANQTAAITSVVTICAQPAPTNVVVGALDIAAVDVALAPPLLSKVKIKV